MITSFFGCADSFQNEKNLFNDPEIFQPALESVIKKANFELTQPHSKLNAGNRDPRFGPREYVSLATYWWPNPDTELGLPYVRRDGRVNPETMSDHSNLPQLIRMSRRIEILGAAYRLTGNEIYAKRAVDQLKIWFINPETSMLPHLEHAQMIRGRDTGRSYGVIDGWWLIRVVDSFSLLSRSQAWSAETENELKKWFSTYINWLSNSSFGRTEKSKTNNHGTWYDVQFVTFAIFTGREKSATEHLATTTKKRIGEQILFSGRQKHEASRTRPEHYFIYNLYGLLRLARIAKDYGIDMAEPDFLFSGSLQDAYEFVISKIGDKHPSTFTEPFDETDTARIWYLLLAEAVLLFDEPSACRNLEQTIRLFPDLHPRFMSANPEAFLQISHQNAVQILH